MLPSWAFIVMIVIGGGVAVVGNIFYQTATSREAKERLANDARTILLPEIRRNSALVSSMQSALATGSVPFQMFDVTAWEAISKGGLLLGLKSEEITKFLHIYRVVYQANHLISQLLEFAAGIGSAMQSAPQTRQTIISNLQIALKELEVAFSEVDQKS
jgi:hypothetical protein